MTKHLNCSASKCNTHFTSTLFKQNKEFKLWIIRPKVIWSMGQCFVKQEAWLLQIYHASAIITPCKVIDFYTNRKPTYNFTLENDMNLHCISYCCQVIMQNWSYYRFWQRCLCLCLMHLFSVISANIAINQIIPKSRFFGLHFFGTVWSIFNHSDITGLQIYQIW